MNIHEYQLISTNIRRAGFTLVELLVVLGALALLFAVSIPAFRSFGRTSDLNNGAEEIMSALRLARERAAASEGASRWGVKFSTSTTPNQFILFKGNSYLSRDTAQDRMYRTPAAVEIFETGLTGGSEVVFARLTGTTTQAGMLRLRLAANPMASTTVAVDASGRVSRGDASGVSLPTPSPRDSRHVHVDYSRAVSTATENIVLTFEGGTTETIPIASNLEGGQIVWQGTVSVAGQNQTLGIRTHRLNNPDAQFSVRRDRRYNTKAVTLSLSGDASGTFLEYSADGLATLKTSVYASDPQWQ